MNVLNRREFIAGVTVASTAALANGQQQHPPLPKVLLPYLQKPTPDGMTICLPAQEISQVKVHWKASDATTFQQVAAEKTVIPNTPWGIWKGRIERLKPGATYEYFVRYDSPQGPVRTENRTFKTFDPQGSRIRCAVLNDIHNQIPTLDTVMSHVNPKDYDFTILNGDMENDPGQVDNVLGVWNEYNRVLNGSSKPMVFVRGNHELRGGFRDKLAVLFDLPHLDLNDHPNNYRYECDWQAGPVHFIATDTGEDDDEQTPVDNYRRPLVMKKIRERQREWLEEMVATKPKQTKWRIFVSHIPLFNTAPWISAPSRRLWLPSIEKMGIDLALAGHDHSWKFIAADKPYKAQRGKDLLATEVPPFPSQIGGGPAVNQGTVILIDANSNKLSSRMYHSSGKLLHAFEA